MFPPSPFLLILLSSVLATPVTTTATATATATISHSPTPSCPPPTFSTPRPICPSSGSSSFHLQLAPCPDTPTNLKNKFLVPTTNTTTDIAHVFVSSTSDNEYLYPSGFASGPWAWRGEFASTVTGKEGGKLGVVTFAGGSQGGQQLTCGVGSDLVEFECAGVETWFVKGGELFAGSGSGKRNGYARVVPFIVQGCSSAA